MSQFLDPAEVGLEDDKTLTVTWTDAHQSRYPIDYLRGYCPCAQCQGHGGGWNYVVQDEAAHQGLKLAAIEEVGHYAFKLIWADGHDTGIYSFDKLRELCTCQECQEKQGLKHPLKRMPADIPYAL